MILHTCPQGHLTVWRNCPVCIANNRQPSKPSPQPRLTAAQRQAHAKDVADRLLAKAAELAKKAA